MGLSFKSTPTAVALLALSSFGATRVHADGKFIVQPSRQKPATVAAVEPANPQSAEPANPQRAEPAANLQNVDEPARAILQPAQVRTLPAPTALGPATSLESAPTLDLSPPADHPHAFAGAPVFSASQPAAGASQAGLRWITRGERTERAEDRRVVGPIEMSNPNFPEPATAASAAATPAPRMPDATSLAGAQATIAAAEPVAEASPRAVLASLVSSQITSGSPASGALGRSVESIDSPPGWQAVGEELKSRIDNCEELINRKAYFSAREDAEAGMLYLVRVLDLLSNSYRSEPAWHAASKAMSEAEDFSTAQRLTSDSDLLRRVILSHETPVLKDADAATLAPLAAAQHYRQYAEDKLIEAAQGHPWASEMLYALGRSYQAQADAVEDGSQQNLRWRAATLYRGARFIAPNNALANNQLGFVLLQMDRPADAREALVASINAFPSLAAYENLVEASRRLGDSGTSNWARQQALALKSALAVPQDIPAFIEVDPRTFAAMSPYTIGPPAQSQHGAAQPYRTAGLAAQTNN